MDEGRRRRGQARRLLFGAALTACAAAVAACPGGSAVGSCEHDRDCPPGYTCDPTAELCTKATGGTDAGAGDTAEHDAAGWDARAGDSGAPDTSPADAQAPDLWADDHDAVDAVVADGARPDSHPTDAPQPDAQPTDAPVVDAPLADVSTWDAQPADAGQPDGAQPRVEIGAFLAQPEQIAYGSSTVLHWEVQGATTCWLDGVEMPAGESVAVGVSPPATHTYELLCEGPAGADSAETVVEVVCDLVETLVVPSSTVISRQSELDQLVSSVSGCYRIDGPLKIHFSTNIVDLTALEGLVEVTDDVDLVDNSALESLDGLEALQHVGGDLWIGRYWGSPYDQHFGNPALASIKGLSGLHRVEGYLQVQDSPDLTSLKGLDELSWVGGRVLIQHLPALADVRGLRRLQQVGLDPTQDNHYFWLETLPQIRDLDGLQRLAEVGGAFGLRNMGLTTLAGVEGLRSVGGSVEILENDELVDLEGLQGLTSIGWELFLQANPSLATVEGLRGLVTVADDVELRNNDSLSDVEGLRALRSIGDELVVINSELIATLEGLRSLETLGGDLRIENNAALAALGLNPGCAFGGEVFRVVDNPELPDADVELLMSDWGITEPPVTVEVWGNRP